MSESSGAAMTVAPHGAVFAVAMNRSDSSAPTTPEPAVVPILIEGRPDRREKIRQVLYLRLEGLSISAIAQIVGCDRKTVRALINLWQFQVSRVLPGEFTPLSGCPQRARKRRLREKKLPTS